MLRLPHLVLLVLLVSFGGGTAAAQEFGRIEDTQAVAPGYFFYARPGEAVVAVTAFGGVGQAGRYLLGDGATVADLLALSGGAQPGRSQGIFAGDEAAVRLYRGGEVVYEAPLQQVYSSAPPRLEDDDIVEVVALVNTARGFYIHAQPGEGTVVVTVAGSFEAAGRYVLEGGSRVGDVVALAGGVSAPVLRSGERLRSTVRLYRAGTVILESPLKDLYTRATPVLEPGDVVDLETFRVLRFTWRDAISIATGIGALALAVDRLSAL